MRVNGTAGRVDHGKSTLIQALTDQIAGSRRGHFLQAISVEAFQPIGEFKAMMDAMIRRLRQSKPASGHDRVYVAGMIERDTELERRAHGIPLHRSIMEALEEVGARLGVALNLTAIA